MIVAVNNAKFYLCLISTATEFLRVNAIATAEICHRIHCQSDFRQAKIKAIKI